MPVISFLGNLTKDPLSKSINGQTACDLSVAENQYVHGEQRTNYYRVTLWGKTAENAAKYLQKGSGVYVHGELEIGTYTDRQGAQRISLDVARVYKLDYTSRTRQAQEQPGDAAEPEGVKPSPPAPPAQVDLQDDLPF